MPFNSIVCSGKSILLCFLIPKEACAIKTKALLKHFAVDDDVTVIKTVPKTETKKQVIHFFGMNAHCRQWTPSDIQTVIWVMTSAALHRQLHDCPEGNIFEHLQFDYIKITACEGNKFFLVAAPVFFVCLLF